MIDTSADQAAFVSTDGFGKSATYRALGSATETSITVLVETDRDRQEEGGHLLASQERTVLVTRVSEVANPQRGDTVTIDGTEYTVDEIGLIDDGIFRDLVVRPEVTVEA